MGSALVTPDLHAVNEDEWSALLTRLVTTLAPPGPGRDVTTDAMRAVARGPVPGSGPVLTSVPAQTGAER